MKTTSLFCLVCFLSLSLNTINVKAKTIDYYNIPVIFVNENKREVKTELKQEVIPPKIAPAKEVKEVDFLDSKMSKDFLVTKKKAIKSTPLVQVETEIYETGRLPEFPNEIVEQEPIAKNGYSKEEVIELIKKYSQEYRLDEVRVLRIAKCESTFNPNATSPSGKYKGVMQWDTSFYGWAKKLGIENADPFNPEHNIRAATLAMSYGLWSKWSCK